VASEQPDEAVLRVTVLQFAHRIHRIARARAPLDLADADPRTPCHPLGGGEARVEWRHVASARLEGIAGRDEPPHLVEAERLDRREADASVREMRRVEGATEETDPRHAPPLACGEVPA